jgi:putative GTP pyrophosphokinase
MIGGFVKGKYIDMIWNDNPKHIRKFHENKQMYSIMCDEVKFILTKSILSANIEVASITARTKTEASFCEKIHRKNYKDPFHEITDFSGARIVFLYASDRGKLENIIESEFKVIEKADKVQGSDVDQFGYGALHYLVKLKSDYLKARYPELENLVCEIQVRTILQDAWAVVAHHLSYKQESDIPQHLRRKLNALSGLFETADDQFETIRELRSKYQKSVSEKIENNQEESLESEIELDNLKAYLSWKFPNRKKSDSSTMSEAIHELKSFGYTTLKQLDEIIEQALEAAEAYEAKYPPYDPDEHEDTSYTQIGIVRVSLEFVDHKYLERVGISNSWQEKKLEFSHLVKRQS